MEKFKNLAGYLIAIIVILLGAYFSGFLKGFAPKDFADAYNNVSQIISSKANESGKYIKSSSGNGQVKKYGKYSPNVIDEQILVGSSTTGAWTNVFKSSKKTVFYIYEDKNDSFHSELTSYINKNNLNKFYNIYAITKNGYMNNSVGNSSYAKICNSLQECKAQRDRAANYTKLANFMESCGKTICVIDGSKKQYIKLYKRDVNEAKQLLEGAKLW